MNNYNHYLDDDYKDYESEFNPLEYDRKARRKRKKAVNHEPKMTREEIIEEIAADTDEVSLGFETTYKPGIFEEGWLLQSLRTFFDRKLITDIEAQVKGGKEASVYRCEANRESTGTAYLAAKVYRPRQFRQLRNDQMYREGRSILKANGEKLDGRDDRIIRAIGKKSAFGEQVAHTSWLTYEYVTLEKLYDLGADVPKPHAAGENAIIMDYLGDANLAAPALNAVKLDHDEARRLFKRAIWNINLMLQNDIIHGDLSAYNILYWQGDITLIDFPQVTDPNSNSNARMILERDCVRVCEYFASQGVQSNPKRMANALWERYFGIDPEQFAADMSRFEVEEEDYDYDDTDGYAGDYDY